MKKPIKKPPITVHGRCMDVHFNSDDGDSSDNSDTYYFTLDAWSQGVELLTDSDRHPHKKIKFGIIGNIELDDFFNAIAMIARMRNND